MGNRVNLIIWLKKFLRVKRPRAKYLNPKFNNPLESAPETRVSYHLVDTVAAPLDTVRNSAYTTEFLDGPEKLIEQGSTCNGREAGPALIRYAEKHE
jgi:hypothetical protein